jgi:hypothetical protein
MSFSSLLETLSGGVREWEDTTKVNQRQFKNLKVYEGLLLWRDIKAIFIKRYNSLLTYPYHIVF